MNYPTSFFVLPGSFHVSWSSRQVLDNWQLWHCFFHFERAFQPWHKLLSWQLNFEILFPVAIFFNEPYSRKLHGDYNIETYMNSWNWWYMWGKYSSSMEHMGLYINYSSILISIKDWCKAATIHPTTSHQKAPPVLPISAMVSWLVNLPPLTYHPQK